MRKVTAAKKKIIKPRHTARGIVVNDKQILLMERWRGNMHYFSIPGGGIEKGESAQQTAVREIFEETSVKTKIIRELYKMFDPDGHIHTIFLCEYISGIPNLSANSEEAKETKETKGFQRYNPRWIKFEEISSLPFLYWQPIADQLVKAIKQGWPDAGLDLHPGGHISYTDIT